MQLFPERLALHPQKVVINYAVSSSVNVPLNTQSLLHLVWYIYIPRIFLQNAAVSREVGITSPNSCYKLCSKFVSECAFKYTIITPRHQTILKYMYASHNIATFQGLQVPIIHVCAFQQDAFLFV